MSKTEIVNIPSGSASWFVCRAKGITTDIMLPIRAAQASEADLAKRGRIRAARSFKRQHGLHPCIKVDCEFQGIETPADRAAMESLS